MAQEKINKLQSLSKLIRYWILMMTTEAGSGHPTSSLSAVELMVGLMFGGNFKYKIMEPGYKNNDRLIFSKGHASPLFYALWAAVKQSPISLDELLTLRKFHSHLEGHPTMKFPYTEAATGSLGQGLSVGLGMAMNAKLDNLGYRTYVLLGDSEMAEGSNWEAMELAAHYKLNNLVGILDVNRLGQRGVTMYGHNVEIYKNKADAFGWKTIVIDGHNLNEVKKTYSAALKVQSKPVMIIAKTVKGKGVSFLEDKDGWHGKALSKDEFKKAVEELGEMDQEVRGKLSEPEASVGAGLVPARDRVNTKVTPTFDTNDMISTRQAYGKALKLLADKYPEMVVLDAETSNSTYADKMKDVAPERFFEMFIAEQNMVGAALGLGQRGKIPMVSTFSAFFSRAFDQIRMSQYSEANIKFVGSHAGVSIGEDGSSQMGLEDLGLFRSIQDCAVLYPSDAISTVKLVEEAVKHKGNVYIRTTRAKTPIIYQPDDDFKIGGSKVVRSFDDDVVTLIGAGITLHECVKAADQLEKEKIYCRVIDLYSVKPLDVETLMKAVENTQALIVVEDHYAEGGIGEAICATLAEVEVNSSVRPKVNGLTHGSSPTLISLAVSKLPRSGKPDELLAYEEINAEAIVKKVREVLII